MKRNKLLHIDSVKVHFMYLQAFHFFLKKIWEDVEIEDIQGFQGNYYQLEISMPANIESSLIMHLWEDWTSNLITEMYAAKN